MAFFVTPIVKALCCVPVKTLSILPHRFLACEISNFPGIIMSKRHQTFQLKHFHFHLSSFMESLTVDHRVNNANNLLQYQIMSSGYLKSMAVGSMMTEYVVIALPILDEIVFFAYLM